MGNALSYIKYIHVTLNEKLALWNERIAYNRVKESKKEILRFKDMGCFGVSKNGPWTCGFFDEECVCDRETCPVHNLNVNYVGAVYSWNRAKKALRQTNSIANAVREDIGVRKIR